MCPKVWFQRQGRADDACEGLNSAEKRRNLKPHNLCKFEMLFGVPTFGIGMFCGVLCIAVTHFWRDRVAPRWACALVCAALLLASGDHVTKFTFDGLMETSLAWLMFIQCGGTLAKADSDVKKAALGFLWPIFPLVRQPPELANSWTAIAVRVATTIALVVGKLALLPLLGAVLTRLQWWAGTSYAADVALSLPLMAVFLCGIWTMDLLSSAVLVATAGRYALVPFSNHPLASISVREFWGRRYNNLVSSLLKSNVIEPLNRVGVSKHGSAMAAFAVSAAIHFHVASAVFDAPLSLQISAGACFLVHGLYAGVEPRLSASWSEPVRRVATLAFLALTLPLYVRVFLARLPEWLANNAAEMPLDKLMAPVADWIKA